MRCPIQNRRLKSGAERGTRGPRTQAESVGFRFYELLIAPIPLDTQSLVTSLVTVDHSRFRSTSHALASRRGTQTSRAAGASYGVAHRSERHGSACDGEGGGAFPGREPLARLRVRELKADPPLPHHGTLHPVPSVGVGLVERRLSRRSPAVIASRYVDPRTGGWFPANLAFRCAPRSQKEPTASGP